MNPVLLSFSGDVPRQDIFGQSKRVNYYYGFDWQKAASDVNGIVNKAVDTVNAVKGIFQPKAAAPVYAPASAPSGGFAVPGIGNINIGTLALIGAGIVLMTVLSRR
jgi:hypothetical protein